MVFSYNPDISLLFEFATIIMRFPSLQWTMRDDVLSTLIDNMEFEQNIELRHAYMSSLPQLLTNIGCAKWCEALSRILVEYCEHHTDLRTLKATLEVRSSETRHFVT